MKACKIYGLPYVTASVDVLNQENLIQDDDHHVQASFHFSIFPTANRIQEMNIPIYENEHQHSFSNIAY